ncbi:MAG: DUF2326 domain-containing protein [Longimicrobiales bacterium]
MKLSRIYSNKPQVFPAIDFNAGLNVIYAEVTDPEDRKKDSHNLGKSLLVHLIDFLLLKQFERGHFLYDNRDRFSDFVFYLELRSNTGQFVTVRRSVSASTRIMLHAHSSGRQDLSALGEAEWSERPTSFEKARNALNEFLSLTAVSPWTYRKGVGYFLRTQNDYRDVFQLARFSVGAHREWKPFLAQLLGFESEKIEAKYQLDQSIDELERARANIQKYLEVDSGEYDRIKGALQVTERDITRARSQLERFSFREQELRYNQQLVSEIEREVADLNERAYVVDYEAERLEASLENGESFDLARVVRLYEEAGVALPGSLVRSYEELVDFNRRLTSDRAEKLREQLVALRSERTSLAARLSELDSERSRILAILGETRTLEKFRQLQADLAEQQADLARLQQAMNQLDSLGGVDREIRKTAQKRDALVEEIRDLINRGNPRYDQVRTGFSENVRTILSVPAILSITVNKEGNLQFDAPILRSDRSVLSSSEDKGFSYRRLLCAAFDMALLKAYRDASFYRFAYHDGVLESLDDRKKLQLLDVVRSLCEEDGMQYILTAIEADVPRESDGERVEFRPGEVVRALHDRGDDGRLFQMKKF